MEPAGGLGLLYHGREKQPGARPRALSSSLQVLYHGREKQPRARPRALCPGLQVFTLTFLNEATRMS